MKTYNPKLVLASFLGIPFTGAWADGTFLEIEIDEDAFSHYSGADGEVSRTQNHNQSGTATATFAAHSPLNDILSGFHAVDKASGGGVGPFMAKELNGTTLLLSAEAYLIKVPKLEFGKEMGTRQWVWRLPKVDLLVGGLF